MRYVLAAALAVGAGLPATAPPPGRVVVAYVPDFVPGRAVPDAAVGALVVPKDDDASPAAFAVTRTGVVVVDETGAASFDDAVTRARALSPTVLVLLGPPRHDHLGAVAISGPPGLLRGSTRRDGLVTLADVRAYVRDGTPITTVAGRPRDLAELDRREHLHRRYNGRFLGTFVVLSFLLGLYVAIRRRLPRRAALLVAAYPAAGFVASVVPWWNASRPGLAAVAAIAAATLLLGGIADAVGVAALCTAVFVVDLLTGGHLQETGLASYSAIAGGRFYGLGNVGFAILATAAVVVCGAAARRYGTRAWLGLVPVVAVDGLPSWGADFGGAIALTAACVAAVANRTRRVLLVIGSLAGVAVAAGVALLDYARAPADQTHLGRFVGEVLHGGWTDTIGRKASAATHSVTGTLYPLFVVGMVVLGLHVLRRLRDPALDPTVRALAVLWGVGSLVNDSGIAVAGVGLAVAVPLLVAYAADRA